MQLNFLAWDSASLACWPAQCYTVDDRPEKFKSRI
jgi:hypothetical protein